MALELNTHQFPGMLHASNVQPIIKFLVIVWKYRWNFWTQYWRKCVYRVRQFLIKWYSSKQDHCWSRTMHNIQIYLVSPRFLYATHFTLSCRIPLVLPTNRNSVPYLFAEIAWNSAWKFLFRLLWCWLLLWPLQLIRTGLIWILDF